MKLKGGTQLTTAAGAVYTIVERPRWWQLIRLWRWWRLPQIVVSGMSARNGRYRVQGLFV